MNLDCTKLTITYLKNTPSPCDHVNYIQNSLSPISNLYFNKNYKFYNKILFTSIHKQLFCLKKNQLKQTKICYLAITKNEKMSKLIPKIMFKGFCMFWANGDKLFNIIDNIK